MRKTASSAPEETPARQLAGFIAKFDPAIATLIRQCRAVLRQRMPAALELVYDNYNFFVIGYAASEKPSSCIVSLAAAANGVGLSFYWGATIPDPLALLQGAGTQNRFVRLPSAATLKTPGIAALIDAAIAQAKVPLPTTGKGRTIVRSISAKQRSRRRSKDDR